jgi:transposase
MKTMFEYDLVRRLYYREGLSRHEIARRIGLHRQTINKMLRYSRPPGYRLNHPRPRPKLDRFGPLIDQMLEDDRLAPPKQRHTARRILGRLQEEHGFGSTSLTTMSGRIQSSRIMSARSGCG